MITILCPTRGRPAQFQRMVNSARDTAHNPENVRVLFYVGNDEALLQSYRHDMPNCTMLIGHPWSAVMASNYLAMRCAEFFPDTKLYMVGADDMVFATPHWDKALTDAYEALQDKTHVFSLRDSRDSYGTPHPILTHEFVTAMGYFLPPIFLHWFVDSWTVDIAKSNGCFTHLHDYLLIHDKPSDRGVKDETHSRIRTMGHHDRDTYVNSVCQHFLATEKERLGRMMQQQRGTREHLD